MHRGSLESGTADAFGNYSEMIGMIQRGVSIYQANMGLSYHMIHL